jgi:hydrogenase/urease accessory protein HupE
MKTPAALNVKLATRIDELSHTSVPGVGPGVTLSVLGLGALVVVEEPLAVMVDLPVTV